MFEFPTMAGGGKPLLPWQTLLTAWGANLTAGGASDPVVPAWYDPLANVTLVSGAAHVVPEVRNTAGLSLTPFGSDAPYNASTGAITLNSSTGTLSTGSTTLLDTSAPCSLVVIGTIAAASWLAAIYSNLLGIYAGGTDVAASGLAENFANSTLPSTDTSIRLFIASCGAGDVNIDIPNKARVSATQALPSSGANVLTIGFYTPGAASFLSPFLGGGFIKRVVTSSDITALDAYAVTKGYVPAS